MIHQIQFNAQDLHRFGEAESWCEMEFGKPDVDSYREGAWKAIQIGSNRNLVVFSFRNAEDAMAFKLTWV